MIPKHPIRVMALLLGTALATGAHAQAKLHADQPFEPFELEPEFGQQFQLEVPEDGSHLQFLLESNRELQDNVDLFVRFAEPFSPSSNPFDQALYYSAGETGMEHLEITYASSPPLSPGAWYALVVNRGDKVARGIELTAALEHQDEPSLSAVKMAIAYPEIDNEEDKGFNDQEPFSAQGGNTAETLGEARMQAFEKAVDMLQKSFTSPVAVTVEAFFDPELEGEDENGGGTLASAQTGGLANFPGARERDTFYATSIVPRLAGTDLCRVSDQDCKQDPEADVTIRFNPNPPNGWWYGLQRSPEGLADGYDFIAVAVHEMLHGLGFLTFANVETGALARVQGSETQFTDAYTSQLVHRVANGQFRRVDQLTDEERLEAFTSQADLLWGGAYGDEFWPRFDRQPKPPLYAPGKPNPGSSVSHTNFPDMMFYEGGAPTDETEINIRQGGPELGAAWYFLRDAGWDEDPKEKLTGPPGQEIPRGMWYDRARDGHGFDFQRVGPNWFLVFFTYDDTGDPEWYLAVGEIRNGVFASNEDGLQRYTYDESDANDANDDNVPQVGEAVGSVELDLNADASSPACDDGVDRSNAAALARFSWEIGGESGDWCAEPLVFGPNAPDPDFTGHWYAGQDDQGWGMTIQVRERDDGSQVMVDTLYYYDDEGNPRWAQGVASDFINSHDGQTIDMMQFDGYPRGRNCTPDRCTLDDNAGAISGPLRLRLEEPVQGDDAGSRATLDVDYLGPENGTWSKNFVPIEMLSDPS